MRVNGLHTVCGSPQLLLPTFRGTHVERGVRGAEKEISLSVLLTIQPFCEMLHIYKLTPFIKHLLAPSLDSKSDSIFYILNKKVTKYVQIIHCFQYTQEVLTELTSFTIIPPFTILCSV